MNCQSFENIVRDLARESPMETELRDQALIHVERCTSCARRLGDERMLTVQLRELSQQMKQLAPSSELETRLVAAFRAEAMKAPKSVLPKRWRYLVAAAAVLLAVGGIVGLRLFQSRATVQLASHPEVSNSGTPHLGAGNGALDTDQASSTPQSSQPDVAAKSPRVHKRVRKSIVAPLKGPVVEAAEAADSEAFEITTAFLPLGYVDAASFQDGAQLVRVELPRYAMARFGLPVNMERYDERVKADIWVGADGLAQAIRFVQELH